MSSFTPRERSIIGTVYEKDIAALRASVERLEAALQDFQKAHPVYSAPTKLSIDEWADLNRRAREALESK